ncbi:hypothetical protein [Parerythrobacter jejuensis]|uniref:Uncharacterized protein n=1 Tax=Parerythrobacter jejuensis TaxID=795812 RepID=A0A845AS93_9SPHN|nr:hypothetical protein [Parerythrobacter jejuensis]MXP30992.1 hypothetical protein [Parerythrobacter jejuensis]MXP33752.1 hypothetical protein [Parerythrobacter jejuensis]
MSFAAILALAVAAPISDIPEIVVIAKRLDGVSASVGQDPEGKWHCSLDKSSGVRSLDNGLCKAVTKCVRKGARNDDAIHGCVTKSKRRLLKRFEREYRKRM